MVTRRRILTLLIGCWMAVSASAVLATERIYYFHNDHLGTPQAMSDAAGRTVWTAEYDPFGKATVNQDPDGDGQIVVNNLRFPGQYYDAETGLHYNYHRDYDPATGRYLQPDPIGLNGGLNLYPYVDGNPVSRIDPNGLQYAETLLRYWPQVQQFGNQLLAAMIGLGSAIGIGEAIKETCEDKEPPCPPCRTVSGRIVPVGTIGYRPMDTPPTGVVQHGVSGSHYNLYKANQAPRNSPKPCKCFWQPIGALSSSDLPPSSIPIEPFAD